MARLTPLIGTIAPFLLAGCGVFEDDGTSCTADHRAGILIYVVDNVTGNPVSCGAMATITADGYAEDVGNPFAGSPSCDDSIPLAGAGERPGTYTVTVARTGYYNQTTTGVVVTAGVCHVNTVTVEARMQPI